MTKEEIEKLAYAHWDYIRDSLHATRNIFELPEPIDLDFGAFCDFVGFHYTAAFIHGFKHGLTSKGDK